MKTIHKLIMTLFVFGQTLFAAAQPTQVPEEPVSPQTASSVPAVPPATLLSPSASQAPRPAEQETIVLEEGTMVSLKFGQDLSSKTAAEGDPIHFLLAQDLKVGDVIVAKAGTLALGTVSGVKKAGMRGRAGKLNVRLEYLKCGNTRVRLRGSQSKAGEGKEGTVIALTVMFGSWGMLKHGDNVEIKEGSPLTAFIDEDVVLPLSTPNGESGVRLIQT